MAKDTELDVDLTPLTNALAKVMEEMAQKMVRDALPGLVEKALAEEKVLIKETIEEVTRQIAKETVSATAEAEVIKEIERLKAEA